MRNFLLSMCLPIAIAVSGCGSGPKGKGLAGDERFNKLEAGINQARKSMTPYSMPDFDELDKLATLYANNVKGTPNESTANQLVEKLKDVRKRAGAKEPYEDVKKGLGELDRLIAILRPM